MVGYRHTDLGIFSEKDPRIPIIKQAIRQDLIAFFEEGVEWLVFTGNLGFEYWCLEVAKQLQEEGYDCQMATLFLFQNHGENWNDSNQEKLEAFRQVDFIKHSYPFYENPSQFRYYNQFLLEHTGQAYIFYDDENETNLKYLYHEILKKEGYSKKNLSFDRLNEVAENFEEIE